MANNIEVLGKPEESAIFLPCGVGSTAANLFAAGDMLWWDATNSIVKKASGFTWDTSEEITRRQFKRRYCGIAGEPNFAEGAVRLVKVYTVAEVQSTLTSGSAVVSAEGGATSLVGPEKASGNTLENQKLQLVQDPLDAIGYVVRYSGTANTTVRALLVGQVSGLTAIGRMQSEVLALELTNLAAAADMVTEIKAEDLFGGAVELLSVTFKEGVAITVADAILTIEKAAVDMAQTLTVPVAGAAIGRGTTQSLVGDAARFYAPDDVFSIKSDGGPSAGSGQLLIRYRRLS